MADGFLGRWSRRKLDVQQGRPVEPEPPAPPAPPAVRDEPAPATAPAAEAPPPAPAPTLDEVAALTPDSDYSRFVAGDVTPEVKNAAMKKLFADPHFNVMDGLDVYIDDYSQPDPMPASMLESLASAEFLGLFREEPREEPTPAPTAASVAQSPRGDTADVPSAPDLPAPDADPDLRLQQDPAPGPEGPGPGDR